MKRHLMVACLALTALAQPAAAQTIGYADAIQILARSCGADIEKYCSKAHLGNFEIGRCLAENQSKISSGCATDLVRVRQSLDARAAAQASVRQVCSADIQRLCSPRLIKGGDGHILQCMLKAQPSVSARCNAAITNAGYR